jgi:hypothetical protein
MARDGAEKLGLGCMFISAVMVLTCLAAWITHIIVCLHDEKWGFLIAGALIFPVAIIHGIGCWFGAWN